VKISVAFAIDGSFLTATVVSLVECRTVAHRADLLPGHTLGLQLLDGSLQRYQIHLSPPSRRWTHIVRVCK
jgi:hypothetical protein